MRMSAGTVAEVSFETIDHKTNGHWHAPDGRLFAQDSQQRMSDPKVAERQPLEIGEIGQCHCEEGAYTAGEHAGGRSGHGHTAPPDAHEEQGESNWQRRWRRLVRP